MKKTNSVILLIVATLGLLSLFSCGRRHHDRRPSETYRYEQNEGHRSRGGGCSRSRHRAPSQGSETFQVVYQPNYFMQNIEVHQNISFQDALYMKDPSAKELEQKYDVGGTKLIAEMSADAEGIYCSREPYQEVNINILSLNQLKLHIDNSRSSIYQQIINQRIVINSSNVGIFKGNSLAEIFDDFINTILTGRMVVHLTLVNTTNKSVRCEIKQGQMLEAVKENVQNLVVAETYSFSIAAKQETNIDIRVYCAAQHRGDPSGSQVRFTPYILNASSAVYESQSSVWSYIENGY